MIKFIGKRHPSKRPSMPYEVVDNKSVGVNGEAPAHHETHKAAHTPST